MRAETADLKPIVGGRSPHAAVNLLRRLGWSDERARVDHVPGTPAQYDRLLLGAELTGAGTQTTDVGDLWWTGFQQGARYHLAVVNRHVYWYDFHNRLQWIAAWDEDLRPLNALAPEQFAATGSFAPDASLVQSTVLPERPPNEYLTQIVRDWWRKYLGLDAPLEQHGVLQQHFVNLVARLVLIRTIEDMGGRAWLAHGTLRSIAEQPRAVNKSISDLFAKMRTTVNSQVFSDSRGNLPNATATINLLNSLYEAKGRQLNFAAIEFNMIGRFYERVLGEHHSVKNTKQVTLIGPQEREVTPISHRRELGQYYTPRAVADYIARKVVLPYVRAARSVQELPRVADIAVGSGEMLNAALRAMLSVAEFRRPDSIRYILEEKLVGVDINSTATQLTALNLLRTAVLMCPELLDQAPAFPKIKGLYAEDATDQVLKRIGQVDIVLTNPPFRGQPDWREDVKGKGKKKVEALGGQTNKAGVFLLRAAQMVREGGSLGIVMPNQFFSSTGNREIRAKALERLDVIELVDNQGARIFDGVQNQPGVLIAAVSPKVRAPRMLVTRLAPPKEYDRAVLVTGLDNSPGVSRTVLKKPDLDSDSWFGDPATVVAGARCLGVPVVSVTELLSVKFHRAPIANIKPLGDVWGVDQESRTLVHRLSGIELPLEGFAYLKHVGQPKDGAKLLFPICDDKLRVVFPYNSKGEPLSVEKLTDSSMQEVGRAVVERAKGSLPLKNPDNEVYRKRLASGTLSFFRLMDYRANRPYLLLSRMARIQARAETWSAWAFSDDDNVVPTSGLYAHTKSVDWARLLAVLLNTKLVFEQLRIVGNSRGSGWVEVSPKAANSLMVPDIREPKLASKLAALMTRISKYIEAQESDFSVLTSMAEGLWMP